jgi:death-on-curing protein
MYPSIFEKAAIYLYSLAKNHPFNDANKRTAFQATWIFLKANNSKIPFKKEDLEEVVVLVAKGKMDKDELFEFFKTGKTK